MLEELHDSGGTSYHKQFQAWRRNNPKGMFLTVDSRTDANLHGSRCRHLGSTEWSPDEAGRYSLTKKRKVLGGSLASLNSWAKRHSLEVHRCQHCVQDGFISDSPPNALESRYAVWGELFPRETTLYTAMRENPFLIRAVTRVGIELSVPGKTKAKKVVLRYDHLEALWKAREWVKDRIANRKKLTTTVNDAWKDRKLQPDYTNESQYWALVCARAEQGELHDEEATRDDYIPQAGDRRQAVLREIRERRGQQQFRDALRERHGDRCMVTSCTLLAVLEAAHINPYQGEEDNHPANGLLLRSDIHTLFDLNLLGIEPKRLQVKLHPSLAKEYGFLTGKALESAPAQPPSRDALKLRYKQFQQRLRQKA